MNLDKSFELVGVPPSKLLLVALHDEFVPAVTLHAVPDGLWMILILRAAVYMIGIRILRSRISPSVTFNTSILLTLWWFYGREGRQRSHCQFVLRDIQLCHDLRQSPLHKWPWRRLVTKLEVGFGGPNTVMASPRYLLWTFRYINYNMQVRQCSICVTMVQNKEWPSWQVLPVR